MTKSKFAKRILEISTRHWDYVLAGKRNLSFDKSRTVSGLFGTSIELWLNPEAVPEERKTAWESFQRRMEQ